MADLWSRVATYAKKSPVKFVAAGSFLTLGAIPVLAFVAYSVATLIASIIGAIVIELFLLAVGITGLAFVLFFVTCISVCITSVFSAVYMSYRVASCTLCKTKSLSTSVWPFSNSDLNESFEPQSCHGDDTDKRK